MDKCIEAVCNVHTIQVDEISASYFACPSQLAERLLSYRRFHRFIETSNMLQ